MNTKLRSVFLLLLLITLNFQVPAHAQAAPPGRRCFIETRYCISGAIAVYWERNGGLPVFGYPISQEFSQTNNDGWTGPTQWFERDRLENHTDDGSGVLAGRLGAYFLELQGRPWQPGSEPPRPQNECRHFATTGYNVCSVFRRYWEQNGGLERFGYPITAAFEEQVEGKRYLVQYFERRRMELHPEHSGTPYEVLLGLLGRDIFRSLPCPPLPNETLQVAVRAYHHQLGCPTSQTYEALPSGVQGFDRGDMLLIQSNATVKPQIYVLSAVPNQRRSRWQVFPDTYIAGEPIGDGTPPPAGRFSPERNFGKIWWNNPAIREALGWAVTLERRQAGTLLTFPDGTLIVQSDLQESVYLLYPNKEAELVFLNR